MAIDVLSRVRRIGFLEQEDWSTPKAANSAFETVYYNADSVKFDPDVNVSGFDFTSSSGLFKTRARSVTDYTSGLPSISFSAPADKYNLAVHFFAALQFVNQALDTTPQQKEIYPYWESNLLDFAGSWSRQPSNYVGAAWTLATDTISGTDGILLKNAIIDTLNFEVDFNARGIGKYGMLSGKWVGNASSVNQNLSGSWTLPTSAYYNDANAITVNIAGVDTQTAAKVRKYALNINNNVFSDTKTAGGKANQYKINPAYQIVLSYPYDSTSYDILNSFISGTEATITLTTGTTGVDGFLEIVGKGRISNNPLSRDGDYESLDLTIDLEKPSSGHVLLVTIADAVDRYYIP